MAKILKILLLWAWMINLATADDSSKVLNIPLHSARISLDPSGIQDISSLFVSRQVNCQLVREQGAIYTLEAAESIKYTSPLEVIIKINKNASFHDGSPITANDVIASFNDIKESRSTLRNIFNWVSEMAAIDSRTVRIKLYKPVPQFLKVLAAPNYGIFKASFMHKARSNNKLWEKPLGCGKYLITENTDSIIKLSPVNDGYHINFYLTESNQLAPSEAEKFDITDLQVSGINANLKNYNIIETYDPTQIYIGLNSNKAPWNSKVARCNFLSKLDTSVIRSKYGSSAKEANDYFPQGILGYDIKNKYMSKIIENNHEQPSDQPSFCLAYLTLSIPDQYRSSYFDAVRKIYPNIKKMTIEQARHFGPDFLKTNCDALIIGLKSNYLDGYEYLVPLSEKNANYTGYIDKELASEIKDSQSIVDPTLRAKRYRAIVTKIDDLCLMRPLVSITMRKIYIRNTLNTPDIGIGPLNEYDLSKVK